MSRVVIVTDSSPNIPNDVLERYQIHVVPLTLIWGDETFADGVDITPEEFYRRLETSDILPSTSQPSVADFKKTFQPLLEDGHDILAVLISDKLSGTIDSAMGAREELDKQRIQIVDSESTAMAAGFQVLEAAKAAQDGQSLMECKNIAEKARENSGVVFVVDTLEFLHRGGRIGGAKRFVGTILNVKPILALKEGEVISIDQVRTHKRALEKIVDIVEERTRDAESVRLATLHANAEETATFLLQKAKEKFSPQETVIAEVSPVIGTHAGPGVVGLAYLTDM